MSIMKTIKFPGDAEPREIRDNRIEIIESVDGKSTLSPAEIKSLATSGKLVYLLIDNVLFQFNPIGLMGNEAIFSYFSTPVDIRHIAGVTDVEVPASLNLNIKVEADGTLTEIEDLEIEGNQYRFALPHIQDDYRAGYLTNIDINGISVPAWAPLPTASLTKLGMVKAMSATTDMTEYVGIDNLGQLRVAPSNALEVDDTLSQAGSAADAQVVGNKFAAIPIEIAEDGYTEISGLRQATHINVTKNSETSITIISTLASGDSNTVQNTIEITLDANGFPQSITTNEDNICTIEWGGF